VEETGLGTMDNLWEEGSVSIYLGKHAAVFQAEAYAILACVYEI
jgi:hypothetical protein